MKNNNFAIIFSLFVKYKKYLIRSTVLYYKFIVLELFHGKLFVSIY